MPLEKTLLIISCKISILLFIDCESSGILESLSHVLPVYCSLPVINGFPSPGPWFNIKMSSYQYRKFRCGGKTVCRKLIALFETRTLCSGLALIMPGSQVRGRSSRYLPMISRAISSFVCPMFTWIDLLIRVHTDRYLYVNVFVTM